MPVGRPATYTTAAELEAKIDEYFDGGYAKHRFKTITQEDGTTETIKIPIITITDLVIFLGFSDRHSFYAYEKKEEFSHTIKRARSFIEREYESILHSGNCTGAIFALKNFGWKDKTEVETNLRVTQMPTIKMNGKEIDFNVGSEA